MSKHTARFLFHGALNDFIERNKKDQWIDYSFQGTPAVKDAIEAIGIPHVEVAKILVDGMPVAFSHHLCPQNSIEVFPFGQADVEEIAETKFVLDVHLGSLTRALRMLGFNTMYQQENSDKNIANIAANEDLIVLTRDIGLLKHKSIKRGYWLRSQITKGQLAEVINRFRLLQHLQPFSRCIACNGSIEPVEKNKVLHQLPPLTKETFSEFFKCNSCQKVYWKGSHFERMNAFINDLQKAS